MELQVDIDGSVKAWLASMGYPVAGMPDELLQGMLIREARQWRLSPRILEGMIKEDAPVQESVSAHASARSQRPTQRLRLQNDRVHDPMF